MRKIIAILFSVILFFQMGGYQNAICYLEQHTRQKLAPLLDQEPGLERAIVEIRVPHLRPDMEYFTDFENQSGYIEWDGSYYTFLKKKIVGTDVLYSCIPGNREHLKDMRYDESLFIKTFPGTENTPVKQRTQLPKSGQSEYDDHLFSSVSQPVSDLAVTRTGNCNTSLPVVFSNVPHSPPKV